MADIFSKSRRSRIMSRIGSKDTGPELIVRRLIHALGFRFRLHRKDLPGTPDIVFPKYKKVIFVHGCFWHGHPGCKRATIPATRTEFWRNKIGKTMAGDKRNAEKLRELGWAVLTIWQCEIKKSNKEALSKKIRAFLTEAPTLPTDI